VNLPRCRRSVLYVPASNPRAIEKARALACDGIILDLEDGVAPEAKLLAREQAVAALTTGGGFGSREVIVRVNGLDTTWGAGDLDGIGRTAADAVLVPKVTSSADVIEAEGRLGQHCATALWAMIETARAIVNLAEVASAASHCRLTCLVLGTNDLANEMGASVGSERTPLLGILGLAVLGARAHRLGILDGVYNGIEDEAGFLSQCKQAADFGFDGKTLIHPSQIAGCNAAFTPDTVAVQWAERVVAAFGDPANADKGALKIEGQMVERLHLDRARRILRNSTTQHPES
jgi:citrate lyase subunit beta / citryl-CoA lyase